MQVEILVKIKEKFNSTLSRIRSHQRDYAISQDDQDEIDEDFESSYEDDEEIQE